MSDDTRAQDERLLPGRRFLIAWAVAVVAVTALAWAALPHWGWYARSETARVERGRVVRVAAEGAIDHLTVMCPSGPVEFHVERPAGIYEPEALRGGDRVLVRFGPEGPSLGPKVRDRALLLVLGAFLLLLVVAGGPRALRAALSLAAAFVLLVVVLVPLTLAGWHPLLATVALSLVISGGTITIVVGWNRKAGAALLGTLGGLVLAVTVATLSVHALALTGLAPEFGSYKHLGFRFWNSPRTGHIDFAGLLVSGVVLSCLGAAMDVAISVATAVHEIAVQGAVSRREALRGGLGVARAAVWMTAATLFFVLFGTQLAPFLARSLALGAGAWARVFSFEEMATEAVRMTAAGLTMTLVGPLTALAASWLLCRPHRNEPDSQRAGWGAPFLEKGLPPRPPSQRLPRGVSHRAVPPRGGAGGAELRPGVLGKGFGETLLPRRVPPSPSSCKPDSSALSRGEGD
jgi:uncharacterized membrane protein